MSAIDNAISSVKTLGTVSKSAAGLLPQLAKDLGLSKKDEPKPVLPKMLPAYYRGVPFAVLNSKSSFGRRNAVHEYPFRDIPWVEDLGRGARKITMHGFLIQDSLVYGGGDVGQQLNRMITAAESAGEGDLVHPTLGALKVGLLAPMEAEEMWDKGRIIFLTFTFIENGDRHFPMKGDATTASTAAAAAKASDAVAKSFTDKAVDALKNGAAVVNQAVDTATSFANRAQKVVNDATNIYHMAKTLPDQINRTIEAFSAVSLQAQTSSSRSKVGRAAKKMISSAVALSPLTAVNHPAAAKALAEAVQYAAVSQIDAIRMLQSLSAIPQTVITTTAPIGASLVTIQQSSADLFRRSVVIALASSTATYEPTSYEDAILVKNSVITLLDDEILIAGNQGEDDAFTSLRAVRAAVSKDLTVRGGSLSPLITVTSKNPMPAAILAQRLYRDPSRAVELIDRAKPIHPSFMPIEFLALAK